MIIRIMGEGQFEIDTGIVDDLNKLDAKLEAALNTGDRKSFSLTLNEMLAFVRERGKRLPDDSLEPSEAVLPSADTSPDELRQMFQEEGLIPGT